MTKDTMIKRRGKQARIEKKCQVAVVIFVLQKSIELNINYSENIPN